MDHNPVNILKEVLCFAQNLGSIYLTMTEVSCEMKQIELQAHHYYLKDLHEIMNTWLKAEKKS